MAELRGCGAERDKVACGRMIARRRRVGGGWPHAMAGLTGDAAAVRGCVVVVVDGDEEGCWHVRADRFHATTLTGGRRRCDGAILWLELLRLKWGRNANMELWTRSGCGGGTAATTLLSWQQPILGHDTFFIDYQ